MPTVARKARRVALAPGHENAQLASVTFSLWNKDTVPFLRDLLLVIAIIAYIIGFAQHTAKMAYFHMSTQLGDQALYSAFNWALDALLYGWPVFIIIAIVTYAALTYAKSLPTRLGLKSAIVADIAVAAAALGGLLLLFGWSAHEGTCTASRFVAFGKGSPRASAVNLRAFFQPDAAVPGVVSNNAPAVVYLLGETDDTYQLLIQRGRNSSGSILMPVAVSRSVVQALQYVMIPPQVVAPSRPDQSPTSQPVNSNGFKTRPNDNQSGLDQGDSGTGSGCFAIDNLLYAIEGPQATS